MDNTSSRDDGQNILFRPCFFELHSCPFQYLQRHPIQACTLPFTCPLQKSALLCKHILSSLFSLHDEFNCNELSVLACTSFILICKISGDAYTHLMQAQISVASSRDVYRSTRCRTSLQNASIQLKEGCTCSSAIHLKEHPVERGLHLQQFIADDQHPIKKRAAPAAVQWNHIHLIRSPASDDCFLCSTQFQKIATCHYGYETPKNDKHCISKPQSDK